tara:strand:+ start:783 stop:1352 length:570 start_codon:yes stop_codon:yes gene_type:complete
MKCLRSVVFFLILIGIIHVKAKDIRILNSEKLLKTVSLENSNSVSLLHSMQVSTYLYLKNTPDPKILSRQRLVRCSYLGRGSRIFFYIVSGNPKFDGITIVNETNDVSFQYEFDNAFISEVSANSLEVLHFIGSIELKSNKGFIFDFRKWNSSGDLDYEIYLSHDGKKVSNQMIIENLDLGLYNELADI